MFNDLLFISLAPVLIIGFYIYSRDKYEKEPIQALLKALFAGMLIVLPVFFIEKFLGSLFTGTEGIGYAAYTAFIVAALTEEGWKLIAFFIFFWKNENFNEKFDGIVYAVFIALGFAAVENMLYVFTGGYGVGVIRALTAVPAHALFGIMMGYYLGQAKFRGRFRGFYLLFAFLMPFTFHGLYDFIMMSRTAWLLVLFVPLFIYFFINGFHKITELSDESEFRNSSGSDEMDHFDLLK
jgi:protease PrsW